MRIRFIGYLSLLSSTFTLAATIPGNPGLALNSPPSTNMPDPPFCLRQDPVCPRPLLAHCNDLLRIMTLNAESARQLRTFVFRPPEAPHEWQVPSTFTLGTCRITIAMVPGEILEFSTFAEIESKAAPLVAGCLGVTTPEYYGGYNVAGVAETLGLVVHGLPTGSSILDLGGGVANYTGADLTSRAANKELWCQRIDQGKIYTPGELGPALNAVNRSLAASARGSVAPVEQVDVTK